MKNLKFILGLLVSTALLSSCSKDDNEDPGTPENPSGKATYLSIEDGDKVQDGTAHVEYTEANFLVPVNTDAKTLEVSIDFKNQADALWCSAKYTSKTKQLKVSVKENRIKDDGERKAIITLTAEGLDPVTLEVKQDASLIEHDPFEVDFGAEWDNTWVVDCYMHGTKYDPILWNDGKVPATAPDKSWWQNAVSSAMTVALKLDQAFLTQFGGQQISKLELLSTINPNVTIQFSLMTSDDAITNDGSLPSYVEKYYTPNNTIWQSQAGNITAGTDANGWWSCDCSQNGSCTIPNSGNVFVVATITGGGEWYQSGENNWGEFQWVRQVLNKFTPTYINFNNASAQKLYKFVGGTISLNMHMASN